MTNPLPTADQELLPGTRRQLLRLLAAEQVKGRAPSIVASVVRAGRPVWTGGRGRAAELGGAATDGTGRPGPDTQYRIGSITKTFTAVLVMRLREEGRLALGDPLDRHLPGTPVGDRTIAQLLAHLGGITAETPPPWWERVAGSAHPDLADALGPTPARFRPGRRHHYSNVGFAVLGELVARLRAMSWEEALHRELLAPLGMTRTTAMPTAPHAHGYAVHPHADLLLPEPAHDAGVLAPAGQLWSTGTDLARWAAVLGGHTDAVLSLDALAEMREPAAVEGDTGDWRLGAGLGVQLLRVPAGVLVGHGGSMPGFVAALWTRPAGTAAVAMANATSGVAVGELAVSLIDAADTAEPPLPAEWVPAGPAGREPLELTGVWYWGAAPYSVTLRADGSLLLAPVRGLGRASLLRAGPAGDTWTGVDGYFAGETLTPCRRPDGGVSHLELASFVFTRGPYAPAGPVPGGVDGDGWRAGPGAAPAR
ncbi:serine hydrolase [Frankia sp. AgB32]|uniref:serine hydrolase domain-containing protein n=1 Tax=Frankia sp. AgB32 TaxID=631119 RepID=UPI00200BAB24|nr:serine hydrolase domain-containing protein [Frankia sp. AgB32]MCK9898348.1 beta-lactamase family protein [Frankia sp. AgB32]